MSLEMNYHDEDDLKELIKNAKLITIDGSQYRELINVMYTIEYIEEKVSNRKEEPETEDDFNERNYLVEMTSRCVGEVFEDLNTRRAIFPISYESNGLCKCICSVHFFVREGKLYINQYYRSQNFERNFKYDCETACILMSYALASLNYNRENEAPIQPGTILVFCANLHIKL